MPNNSSAPKARPSFYLVLFLLPMVILLLLELGLRLIGFGKIVPLFTADGAPPGYLQPNPEIITRYFPRPELAPNVSPDTVYFPASKAPDTFRIVIQGGSTAAGFPYGRFGSLQGMLEQRVKRLYPDTRIEIVNTALSAVNSYSLLDFVDEILDQRPDLVLIYAGHNEYLGVMGAGSAFAGKGGRTLTLLYLKLRNLRLYQLLERLLAPGNVKPADGQRSVMAQVAKGREIPFDGEIYHAGLTQFAANLKAILKKYRDADVPVIVGTLASNEKDQVPFSVVTTVTGSAWEEALSASTNPARFAELREKIASDNGDAARHWYLLGLGLYEGGDFAAARDAFIKARDLDSLRFRAPSRFNDIIRQSAETYGAYIAEVERMMLEDSERGIIGNGHMLEHLHPNARGYFLLSEAFVDVMLREHAALDLSETQRATVTRERAWNEIPLTLLARAYGKYKISRLTRDYPFTLHPLPPPEIDTSTFIGQLLQRRAAGDDWLALQQTQLRHYQERGDFAEAARVAGIMSDALVGHHQAASVAGRLYRKLEDWTLAGYYFRRALHEQQTNVRYHLDLAQTYFMAGRVEDSLELLDAALALEPDNKTVQFYHAKVKNAQDRS